VDVVDSWQPFGVTTAITATADEYYHFTNWTGDASGGVNPLNLLMDSPKSVTANFAQNMTTSSPTPVPEEWLAEYGLTNFEEDVNGDPDNDGQLTWEEYLAAETDPTNPLSYFHTGTAFAYGTNYVENVYTNEEVPYDVITQRIYEVLGSLITWPSVSGRVYDVDVVPGLPGFDWTHTQWTNVVATPTMNAVTNPNAAMTNAGQFFRARARME